MTEKKTNETKTSFADLLQRYSADPRDSAVITELATATAYSVLKKCIDTSCNDTLSTVRRELAAALANISGIERLTAAAYSGKYTEDGDYITDTTDPTAAAALVALTRETLGGGLDLVNVAVVAILEEKTAQVDRDPDSPIDLERPYTVRRLSHRVYIRTADSVGGWETVETSPIREIFKSVRRYIAQTAAAATDPRNGYSYIADTATDPETGDTTEIYLRLPKYANLGGYATDYNGGETMYTIDPETVADTDSIIDGLHLTPRQKKIIDLRLSGYGYKAIATYLGVTPQAVQNALKAIQKKAAAVGLTPTDPTPTAADPTPTAADPTPTAADPTPTAADPTPTPTDPTPIPTAADTFEVRVLADYLTTEERHYLSWLNDRNIFNR